MGGGFLYHSHDDIPNASVTPVAAAQNADALQLFGAGIISYL
jgi:hypothetical protein